MLRSYKRKALFYREMSFWGIRVGGHAHVNDIKYKGMWPKAQREAS